LFCNFFLHALIDIIEAIFVEFKPHLDILAYLHGNPIVNPFKPIAFCFMFLTIITSLKIEKA